MENNNKPQHMTSLHGDVMVRKDDPRIHFRGLLDGAMADTGFGAALALSEGNVRLCEALGDINRCLMAIMSAHVRRCEPELPCVAGRDMELLHDMSHNPQNILSAGILYHRRRTGCPCHGLTLYARGLGMLNAPLSRHMTANRMKSCAGRSTGCHPPCMF